MVGERKMATAGKIAREIEKMQTPPVAAERRTQQTCAAYRYSSKSRRPDAPARTSLRAPPATVTRRQF